MKDEQHKARPLEALGISELEERAYRALLARRMATVEDVAARLALPARTAQRLLERIETKGLATHSPQRPRRYIATSPDIAVEALASQRHADIERARSTIRELKAQAAEGEDHDEGEQMVELITSRQAVEQIFGQLLQTMQKDVVAFQRAPVLFSSFEQTDDAHDRSVAKALRGGVRLRAIADAEFLALPGAIERVRMDMAAGEDVRIFPALPFKMVIIDRRIGLIPLNLRQPDGPSLLLRSSALLDALYALFENLWERATPITFTRSGALRNGEPFSRLPSIAEHLIPLLAAGLNDKAIAVELKMSSATLNRRMVELMKALDARTRFQMGWVAALNAFPERAAAAVPEPESSVLD